jgi:sulfur carrier protein
MNGEASIRVNGEDKVFEPGAFPATVADLVARLSLDPRMVVAEVNGEIVSRGDAAGTRLTPGDVVELVRFVGGG